MILFPAIDLKDGLCVRLAQGDMTRATVFNAIPPSQAQAFESQGFEYLHVVDLDGAFAGQADECRCGRAASWSRSRSRSSSAAASATCATVEGWLEKGVTRVIIGTAAVRDPPSSARRRAIIPGASRSGSMRATARWRCEGWAETSELTALDIARRFEDVGVAAIIYTDIARDGMLAGLNLDATIALAEAVSIPVIASGGLASIEDVKALLEPRAAQACRRDRRPRPL